jgi:hypothetical protein
MTFLVGFAAMLWLSGAALEELRGPRAGMMRELNALRVSARIEALHPDPHLGRVAQRHARELARGSRLALASGTADLERSARGTGWRGNAPLREWHLRVTDVPAALREANAGPESPAFLDPSAKHVGVGLAPAPEGAFVAVILLAP